MQLDVWDVLAAGGLLLMAAAVYLAFGWMVLLLYVGALMALIGLFGARRGRTH